MRFSVINAIMLVLIALPGLAIAATIHVPGDQPTIQAGIDAAVNGDTVLVAPGTYVEHIDFLGKTIRVIGSGSPELTATILEPVVTGATLVRIDKGEGAGTELSGFTLQGCTRFCIWVSGSAAPLISNNVFRWNRYAVVQCIASSPQIRQNLFVENTRSASYPCVSVESGTADISNNTFDGNSSAIMSPSDTTVARAFVRYNCVTNSPNDGIGMSGLFVEAECNNVWNNGTDYFESEPSPTDISADPQYCDPDNLIYKLQAGSPCLAENNACGQLIGALGTGCDGCNDIDGDSQCTIADNCPLLYNPGQLDSDLDGLGDVCDNCPNNYNPDQEDSDSNGIGDSCSMWSVSLDYVDGAVGSDEIMFGQQIRFHIRITNNDGCWNTSNGFRIYSLDGAEWGSTEVFVTGEFNDEFLVPIQTSTFSADGMGADTVYIAGIVFLSSEIGPADTGGSSHCFGLGPGYDFVSYVIMLGGIDSQHVGTTLCIDSSWAPPGGIWKWISGNVTVFPTWDGPHCFEITDNCCIGELTGNVDYDPADLVDLGDLTALINSLFIYLTLPACMDEANIDGDPEGTVDLGDLTALIDYLFISFTLPAPCQ